MPSPVALCCSFAVAAFAGCVWASVAYVGVGYPLISLASTVMFGLVTRCILHCALVSPPWTSVIWPHLPCALGATGGFAACYLRDELVLSSFSCLLFIVLPSAAVSLFWLRGISEDVGRASLMLNLFASVWGTLVFGTLSLVELEAALSSGQGVSSGGATWTSETFFIVATGSMAVLGLVALLVGSHVRASRESRQDAEMVWATWALNFGALFLFIGAGVGLHIPSPGNLLSWLLFVVVVGITGVVGQWYDQAFPVLLCGIGVGTLVVKVSAEVGCVFSSVIPLIGLGVALVQHCKQAAAKSQQPIHHNSYVHVHPDDVSMA